MQASLVLNATYAPMGFCAAQHAISLVVLEKAEILEGDESKSFRSEKLSIPFPKVIRLLAYVEIPQFMRKNVSKKIAYARDFHTCQYCGRHKKELKKKERLTIDHVKPVSKGGKTTWDNIVTACNSCNDKKGNKLPFECRMYPRKTPKEPRYVALILSQYADEDQRKYFEGWT